LAIGVTRADGRPRVFHGVNHDARKTPALAGQKIPPMDIQRRSWGIIPQGVPMQKFRRHLLKIKTDIVISSDIRQTFPPVKRTIQCSSRPIQNHKQ